MTLALTFADLTKTLAKFTAVPLVADLFDWCDSTGNFRKMNVSLALLSIPFTPSMTVSDLKAKIERRLVMERGKRDRNHWSFDANRLVAFKQMLAAIEKFQEAA